jgi:hypothetical protein
MNPDSRGGDYEGHAEPLRQREGPEDGVKVAAEILQEKAGDSVKGHEGTEAASSPLITPIQQNDENR